MTTVVADANILLRLADPSSALRSVAVAAVSNLITSQYTLRTVPQAIYEFWVVATRPTASNGLGLSISDCEAELVRALAVFPLLDDRPTLCAEWRKLVLSHSCLGKVAHDARYVAAMNTHGVTHLLTFNVADFNRYPHIHVLDPRIVAVSVPQAAPTTMP